MKVKLIYPPANNSYGNVISPSYHIATLARILKNLGHEVKAQDIDIELRAKNKKTTFLKDNKKTFSYLLSNQDKEYFEKNIKSLIQLNNEDYIGIQVTTLQQFCVNQLISALCIAKYIKDNSRSKLLIFGHYPNNYAKDIITKFKYIDAVFYHHPETAIEGMIKVIEDNKKEDIPNLYYRLEGQVYGSGKTKEINLEDVPLPDFSILPLELYKEFQPLVLPYEISRGCPNNCFFCCYIYNKTKPNFKSPKKVAEELKALSEKYQTKNFHFIDSSINNDKEKSLNIFNEIIKNKININWTALATPQNLDQKFIQTLKSSGCKLLRWGIESGSQPILDQLDKKLNPEEMQNILRLSRSNGIYNHISIIVGMPDEEKQDTLKTINFIKNNKDYIDSANLVPLGRYNPKRLFDLLKTDKEYQKKSERAFKLTKLIEKMGIFHKDSIEIVAKWPNIRCK